MHPFAELSGDWTLEKWEYWLRDRPLSGPVRNLAQHGVMTGPIGAVNTFLISPDHRMIANQSLDGLLGALREDWPQVTLHLQLTAPEGDLPLDRKQQRQQQAEAVARHQVLHDPLLQPLFVDLDASLVSLTLREPKP